MPISADGSAAATRPLPLDPLPMDPGLAPPAPWPVPIHPGGDYAPSAPGWGRFVRGTESDDRLELTPASIAFGGGGDDVFVLTSSGGADGPELLGTITDFGDGDRLDLSALGEQARELAREVLDDGATRVSVDYDGDGGEDGFVILSAPLKVDPDAHPAMPEIPGEVRILPAFDGDLAVSSVPGEAGRAMVALDGWIV